MSPLVTTSVTDIVQPTVPGGPIVYSDYELDTSSPYAGGCAWIEGEFVPAGDARISIFDTGFGHSDVTYTVASVWHGRIFRLDDHIKRFLDGSQYLRLASPKTADEIAEIAKRCVALSQLREAYVCLALTRGYSARPGDKDTSALVPQLYVYAIPYLWVFSPEEQVNGMSAVVARRVQRAGRNVIDPGVKNFQWGDLIQANFEAEDRGARTAILLDANNCLAEGPGFNVVIVKDGQLRSSARNALPGITRKTAYEIAASLGIPCSLGDVTEQEIYEADEIMATTTAGGITPIVELDGKPIGSGAPGPITTAIRDRFWQVQVEDSALVEGIDYAA